MNSFSFNSDSLEDSREHEIAKLREEVKKKNKIISDNGRVIVALREQLEEAAQVNEEAGHNDQILRRDLERSRKELSEKCEEFEAVTHALKEVETANESLSNRMQSKNEQLKKLAIELANTKKDLDELRHLNEELESKHELLGTQLNKHELALKRHKRDEEEPLTQELHELRGQVAKLKAQLTIEAEKTIQLRGSHSNEMIDLKNSIHDLKQQNDGLINELKNRPTTMKQHNSLTETGQTMEEMVQELYDLRAKCKSLSHRQSRRSIDEEILKLRQELEVTETSWNYEKKHKERYSRENLQLEKRVNDLTKEINTLIERCGHYENRCRDLESKLHQVAMPPPPLPPKDLNIQTNNVGVKSEQVSMINPRDFSVADEVPEFMDSSSIMTSSKNERTLENISTLNHNKQQSHDFRHKRSHFDCTRKPASENYCQNHRIQKSQIFPDDPIAEEKMRLERASELARRNKLTKPLHQTSYALELETFDDTANEFDIKRGNLRRQALADSSNQKLPPKPVKKAEAFVV